MPVIRVKTHCIWKCESCKGFIYHVFIYFFFPRLHVKFSCTRNVNGEIYCLHSAHTHLNSSWTECADVTNRRMDKITEIKLHDTMNGPFGIDRIFSDN